MSKLNRKVLYLQASGQREQLQGEQHSSVATTLKILAELYYYQGRYDQAEELLVEASGQREQLQGEQHSSVAT
ncbi:tetratricopeptide repeat protein, partial [Nostoc sp. CALU 1950]|uniref:tetratricopeptide repeat protein n=1 Tax=Nostoc sp. CALU 1950 TaxID=3104321 RepID=UPI003EB80343